jgi:hypothetical protein
MKIDLLSCWPGGTSVFLQISRILAKRSLFKRFRVDPYRRVIIHISASQNCMSSD